MFNYEVCCHVNVTGLIHHCSVLDQLQYAKQKVTIKTCKVDTTEKSVGSPHL